MAKSEVSLQVLAIKKPKTFPRKVSFLLRLPPLGITPVIPIPRMRWTTFNFGCEKSWRLLEKKVVLLVLNYTPFGDHASNPEPSVLLGYFQFWLQKKLETFGTKVGFLVSNYPPKGITPVIPNPAFYWVTFNFGFKKSWRLLVQKSAYWCKNFSNVIHITKYMNWIKSLLQN